MTKNEIPIWDNKNDYSADIGSVIVSLLAISDREYQLRVWYRTDGPEVDWFEECLLSFDTDMEYFRSLLRRGKTSLNPAQVKSVLRLHVMTNHFCKIIRDEKLPEDWSEQQLYVINHPYWQKVQKQAAHTLSLLRNDGGCDKPLQVYGSTGTRTASACPNLTDRLGDRMRVFSSPKLRMELWKNRDDFWNSVERYDLVFKRYFDGHGSLPSGRHFDALLAFQEALDILCEPYEDTGGNLTIILTDPNFKKVEKRAQDFLKLLKNRTNRTGGDRKDDQASGL